MSLSGNMTAAFHQNRAQREVLKGAQAQLVVQGLHLKKLHSALFEKEQEESNEEESIRVVRERRRKKTVEKAERKARLNRNKQRKQRLDDAWQDCGID